MAKKLVNLKLSEVSLVDSPANPEAKVVLFKRAEPEKGVEKHIEAAPKPTFLERLGRFFKQEYGIDPGSLDVNEVGAFLKKAGEPKDGDAQKGDGNMPELDELLKGASQEVQDAVKAAMAKRDAELDALRKQVEELSKKTDGDDGPEGINKADLPEAVRKHLEDLEKKAREASEIAKAEREARVKAEVRKRAEGYAKVAAVDKVAGVIYKAQSVSADFANEIEEVLKAAQERIDKGALFEEFGSAGSPVNDDPQAQFAEAVDKYAEEKGVDYALAAREVAKRNPELVSAYKDAATIRP